MYQLEKLNAAKKAMEYIEGHEVIGLGSGTTVRILVDLIAKSGIKITVVPTSFDTLLACAERGIRVSTMNHVEHLELSVDGADQVDPRLNLIKGGGGALTKEKIIAYTSRVFIVMVDESKLTDVLGKGIGVPVEFVIDSLPILRSKASELGAEVLLREAPGKLKPLVSDNGLALADVRFPNGVSQPEILEDELKKLPGVLENGLFTKHKRATLIVGTTTGSKEAKRED